MVICLKKNVGGYLTSLSAYYLRHSISSTRAQISSNYTNDCVCHTVVYFYFSIGEQMATIRFCLLGGAFCNKVDLMENLMCESNLIGLIG